MHEILFKTNVFLNPLLTHFDSEFRYMIVLRYCGQKNSLRHSCIIHPTDYGVRTPNEGINQRNLKFWADMADKICFGRT